MNIRRLLEEDWSLWKGFRHESLVQYPLAFASSLEEEERLTDQQFQDWIKRHTIYGAFIDGALIGCVGFFKLECSKERHRAILFGMGVQRRYQQLGIASDLMKHLLKEARAEVEQLHLKVLSNNEIAIRLYERHGFKIYGTEPRSLKWEDKFYSEHLMVLFFDAESNPSFS